MSKHNVELTSEMISSLHDELYRAYYHNGDFSVPFGKYVAEQFELIYDGINDTVSKAYK